MSAENHAMFVHLPLGMMFILPFIFAWAVWAGNRGRSVRNILLLAGVAVVMMLGAAMLAMETGEISEEILEKQMSEQIIEGHEEAAELFTMSLWITLVLSAAAVLLADKPAGRLLNGVLLIVSLLVAGAGIRAGDLGGKLVYDHYAPVYLKGHTVMLKDGQKNALAAAEEDNKKKYDDDDDDD